MRRFLSALFNLAFGVLLGLLIIEVILRANPKLLLRGMSVSSPVDLPLVIQEYAVHYSDADVFYWRPDLIRPIPPEEDKIEARVHYITDEFGFRNQPPTPNLVDIITLGTSFTVGAQVEKPWIQWIVDENNWQALNLAQPASTLDIQLYYLQKYGIPHHPRWVVIEIMPMLSIVGYEPPRQPFLVQKLTSPLIQQLARQAEMWPPPWKPGTDIYPISVEISERTMNLVCCLHLMNFLTIDAETLSQSTDWKLFEQSLLKIIEEAKTHQICVAILHAPNKPVVYFPLITQPDDLKPVLATVTPLQINSAGRLSPNSNLPMDVDTLIANAYAGNEVLSAFANDHDIVLIEPTSLFQEAIMKGHDPYMVYDSHLNAYGHQILAQLVNEQLQTSNCLTP